MFKFLHRKSLVKRGLASGKTRRRRAPNDMLRNLEYAPWMRVTIFVAFVAGLALLIFSGQQPEPTRSFVFALLLVATAVAHLLLVSTPSPLAYLGWILGLSTAAAAVLPFAIGIPLATAVAVGLLHLVIGLSIGSLVVNTAATEARARMLREHVLARGLPAPSIVVNTHSHGDHTFGNYLFPEATIYAHRHARNERR